MQRYKFGTTHSHDKMRKYTQNMESADDNNTVCAIMSENSTEHQKDWTGGKSERKNNWRGKDPKVNSGSVIISTVSFWGFSFLFLYIDLTGKPQWIRKYKVQPGTNEPLDPARAREAIKVAFINQVLILGTAIVFVYPLQIYMGCSAKPQDLPGGWTILKTVVGMIIHQEVVFYYMHRLAHWGPLYRHIHKKHHEWKSPVGIASIYCHPLEHIFVNLFSFLGGPIWMGAHLSIILVWYGYGWYQTIVAHSNYHLPFMLPPNIPEIHDYHHLKFNCNYGSELQLLDWLHGTNKAFLDSKAGNRNKILFSFKSMRELVPDD